MKSKNQSGRTMMEMLGVLAIIGVITYGAISGINSGMTSYKINQAYIEISDIINGIQDMYLAVYGRSNFPQFSCNTTVFTYPAAAGAPCDVNCSACRSLVDNGILSKNTKNLTIDINERNGLIVQYQAKKPDVCTRLKEMDWAIQSINCHDAAKRPCSDEGATCCNDNKLYFSPK